MADPTDLEQYYLELINDARLDPLGNTARYIRDYDPLLSSDLRIQNALNFFNVSGSALLAGIEALVPVAPLAWNGNLADAARAHNQVMIATDTQSHQLPDEPGLGTRATNAGYSGWRGLGENIYAYSESVIFGHAGFMVDWGNGPGGIQSGVGHRVNIMHPDFSEVGIGVTIETNAATSVGPQLVTQDFGTRGKTFLLGVAYRDNDLNDFYTPGEGSSALSVRVGGVTAQSAASGGYALEITNTSNVAITFSGAGLATSASVTIVNFSENVKADVVDGNTLRISTSAMVNGFADIVVLSLEGLTVTAGTGNQRIFGNIGNDTLNGGSNVDTAVVSGNRSAYTVTQTSTGNFRVVGPDGMDTLSNIEYLLFADQTIRLLPGTGTTVDFSAAASTFMGAIRDFDGNDLGGASGWKRLGAVDVNGDGDTDQIFVNPTISRFAEVATAADGKVYFSDHGWAGETRVVGIYVDPLVQSGEVVAGSDFDSQRRFQNDLRIDNLGRVLGGADYDRDGSQEVYFKVADGTAYLHAYMHADGNIQYANYQTQAQVIDFLTQNGWAASTYDGWFM